MKVGRKPNFMWKNMKTIQSLKIVIAFKHDNMRVRR